MTFRYLLDTNVLSEPVRLRPDPQVLDKLRDHAQEVVTATVVWHELRFGAARLPDGAKRRALLRYLDDVVGRAVPLLAYDGNAATWHAEQRARADALGQRRPFVDGMIAAVARTQNLVLVTNDVADYDGYEGLVVERWHLPP